MKKKIVKKSMTLLLLVLMFFFVIAFSASHVTADVVLPNWLPYVEIQGAKIVSEGAYFYMEIRNTGTRLVYLVIKVPEEFEFEEFDENAGTRTAKWYSLPFHLEPNETMRFHFHAPFIGAEEEQTYDFLLKDEAYGEKRFHMTVVSLGSNNQQENNDPNTIIEILATIAFIMPIAGAVGFMSWLSITKVTQRNKGTTYENTAHCIRGDCLVSRDNRSIRTINLVDL